MLNRMAMDLAFKSCSMSAEMDFSLLLFSPLQFSEAFGKLYGQQKHGLNNDANEHSRSRGRVHENCIKYVTVASHLSFIVL